MGEQTYLKRPDTRFAFTLNDQHLQLLEGLIRDDLEFRKDLLQRHIDSGDKEASRELRRRIKVCREILGKIDSLKEGERSGDYYLSVP